MQICLLKAGYIVPSIPIAFMTKNILLKMSWYFQIVFQRAVKLIVKKKKLKKIIIQSCKVISCAMAMTVETQQQIRTQIWKKYNPFQLPVLYDWNVKYVLFKQRNWVPTWGRGRNFPQQLFQLYTCLIRRLPFCSNSSTDTHPKDPYPYTGVNEERSTLLSTVTPLWTQSIQQKGQTKQLLKSMGPLAQDKAAIAIIVQEDSMLHFNWQ